MLIQSFFFRLLLNLRRCSRRSLGKLSVLDKRVYSPTILLERDKACDLLRTTDFLRAESHPTVDAMRPKIVARIYTFESVGENHARLPALKYARRSRG